MPRLYCNELWEVQSVTSAPQADYVEVCRKSASGPTEVDELWVWTVVSTHRLPGNVPEKSAICKSGEVLMSLHLLSSVCAVSVDQSVWCTVDFAAQRIVGQIRLKSMWPVRRTSGHFLIFCVLRHTKSFSGILNSMVELQQSLFHTPDMQNITLSRVISTCAMNSSRTYQQNNIFEWEKQMICVLEMGLQQVYSFFHSHLSLLSGKWCTVDGQPNCCWNVCTSFTRSCTSFLSVTTVRDTWNSDFVCRAFDWIASMHFAQNPWAVEANRYKCGQCYVQVFQRHDGYKIIHSYNMFDCWNTHPKDWEQHWMYLLARCILVWRVPSWSPFM